MGTPPVPPAGSPPQGGGGDNLNDLQSAANSLKAASVDIANSAKRAYDLYASMPKVIEETGKKFQKASTEMKALVILADDAKDAFKGMSDYTKSLAKGLAQEKSLKNVKATLIAIAAASKKAAKNPLLDEKGVKAANRAYDAAIAKLRTYKGVKDSAFDTSMQEEAISLVKQLGKEYDKLAAKSKSVQFKGWVGRASEGVQGTRKNLIDSGLMKAGRVEKYAAYGEAAIKLKEAAQAKREDKARDFTEKREAAKEKLLAIPGMKEKFRAAGLVTAEGSIDWGKITQNRKTLGKMTGGGDAMQALQDATMQPRGGIMGKLTQGGLVEGGVGAVAGLIGKAAVPLAIAEAVKDLVVSIIDKNAEMNKQAETLYGGGLATGNLSGADALNTARMNLTPQGFLGQNRLGLGYERNVKMAQAMIESGYNVEELAGGGLGGGGRQGEFGPGTFGEVQKIAATSGRVAGMGDAESVKLSMKLLMQYRQSMEGTQDFFTNLNKDTRAAGLSTIKYVSILQEITDQFDRMNKSVDQTSGVLRALSMTGRTTAEDLQENLKMILGDPKRDVGMQIYLDMMQRSSGQAGTNAKQQGEIFNKEANKAYQALAGEGGLGIPNLNKDQIKDMHSNPAGREQLNSLLTTYQAEHPDVDAKKFQIAQGALNTASDEGRRAQLMDDFAKGKISAVDYQSAQAGLGKSAQVQANENLSAAKEVMRRAGISPTKLYEEGGVATTQKAQQLLQAFGLSPTLLRDVQFALQNQGQGRLKAALSTKEGSQALYDKLKDKMGVDEAAQHAKINPATGKPETAREALERWTRDKRYGGKFMQYLRGSDEGIDSLYNTNNDLSQAMDDAAKKAAKTADDEKARSTGMVTQSTADIFANAFSSFFNNIIAILDKVWHILAHSTLLGGVGEEEETDVGNQAQAPEVQKGIQLATKAAETEIRSLKDQLMVAPEDQKSALHDKLADAEDRLKEFQQKLGKDSGVGQTGFDQEMDDIQKTLMSVNDPISQLMDSLKVGVDTNKQTGQGEYTLTPEQVQANTDTLKRFQDLGLITKPTTGTNDQGQTVYHYQTVYNSASWSQTTAQDQATSKSTERQNAMALLDSPTG